MDPLGWVDDELAQLECEELLRALPPPLQAAGATVEVAGRQLINFASNDYLGLAADERLSKAACESFRRSGVGRGASPLVSGRSQTHDQLERRLAQFMGTEAALLFPTSFAANAGIIPALADHGDAIYSDANNHASIIDGCRLSRAEKHRYPHNNVAALEHLLHTGARYRRRLIVTDALFSMDGDLAPLTDLAMLARRYQAMLMVDEAHAVGVFGQRGCGVVEHFAAGDPQVAEAVSVRVVSFGKALGGAGGYVCGSASLVKWLANRARTYVFSTAHPAAISAAALAAVDVVEQQPNRRRCLLERAELLRDRLHQQGWDTGQSSSQIIPVIIGSAKRTMQIAATLREKGLWVPGIRPPSVSEGRSLLRIGLTVAHTEAMIDQLVSALAEVRELVKG